MMYINQTTYSKHRQRQLVSFSFKKRMIPILIVLEAIFLMVALYGILSDRFMFIFVPILLMFIIPLEFYLLSKLKMKFDWKRNPSVQREPTMRFTFEDDFIQIEDLSEDSTLGKVKYEFIYWGSEDLFNFYLFPNPNMAYVIDKKGFESGTTVEIRNFLSSRIKKSKFSKKPY
jgi:hypothetical protein